MLSKILNTKNTHTPTLESGNEWFFEPLGSLSPSNPLGIPALMMENLWVSETGQSWCVGWSSSAVWRMVKRLWWRWWWFWSMARGRLSSQPSAAVVTDCLTSCDLRFWARLQFRRSYLTSLNHLHPIDHWAIEGSVLSLVNKQEKSHLHSTLCGYYLLPLNQYYSNIKSPHQPWSDSKICYHHQRETPCCQSA